jgi:hypothetical protein
VVRVWVVRVWVLEEMVGAGVVRTCEGMVLVDMLGRRDWT